MAAIAECAQCLCRLDALDDDVGRTFPCPYCTLPITIESVSGPVAAEVQTAVVGSELERPRVFVSHSTLDREFVEREIVEYMESQGVDTWYSRDDIHCADHWQRRIIEGLQACDWFLIVMSLNSARSENVKDELHWAIDNRPGRIIPVVIDDCQPLDFHMRMSRIQHVDFRTNLDQGRLNIVDLVQG